MLTPSGGGAQRLGAVMRGVPLSYIARNLWVRRVTTVLTALGMALVVYVFATCSNSSSTRSGNAA